MTAPVHVPHRFVVQGNDLLVGGDVLHRVAERVGQTPFYAIDRALVRDTVAQVRRAIGHRIGLHYAIKANPLPSLLAWMVAEGLVDGFDVASAGEMKRAVAAGAKADTLSFAGPGKRTGELAEAVAAGVLVNVESPRELERLAEVSQRVGSAARVCVRVNPDFELKGSGMRMGGGARPFGIDAELVPGVLARVAELGLVLEGLQIFAGSQSLRADAIAQAHTQAYELARRLWQPIKAPLRRLNLGGGWGIPYVAGEARLDLGPVGDALQVLAERAAADWRDARLQVELGRYLVGEAGVFVARVVERKMSRGTTYLVVDGGLNNHLAATGNFGQVLRRNYPVAIGNRMAAQAPRETVSVVGPLCTPLDLLADRVDLPCSEEGDLFVVFQSGAYGASASPQAFLGHPPCAEVLV